MNTSGSNANVKAKVEKVSKELKEILAIPTKSLEVIAQAQAPPLSGTNSKNVRRGGGIVSGTKRILYGFIRVLLWPISHLISLWPRIWKLIFEHAYIMAHIQLSALLIILEIYLGAVLIETARPGTIVKRGGGYENAPQSIDEFKSRASEIEKVIDNMNEDDKKQLVERINEAVKKINPSGEMTQEAIYKVLLKKLDEWYESSNTKLTTGLFKTRNNTMRALNKLPMLKAAMGLGPMPLGYRLGGKQNQKTRKQRK